LASDAGAFGADFKPTNQQQEVYQLLRKRLNATEKAYQKVIREDIEQFNKNLLREKKEPIVPEVIK